MMDRNREVRRGSMAAVNGGLRRRQQRSTNLRDSPEEDGATEMQETSRLRDRDRERGSKKDRERDRDRSSSRSKRRRGERSMHGISRDEGDDSSDESMDDDDDDEDEDATVSVRLPASSAANPPPPPSSSSSSMQLPQQNQHVRKSFPVKPARPPAPAWKAADEMIGVSIPRKARSSSLKRSQECFSGVGGGGGSGELMHRQPSTSPARPSHSSNTAVSPPSSSNASIRKKKQIGGGSKQHRPPSAKISKSSPSSEIEIEVAEVLFGMTRQSLPSSSSVPSSSSLRPEAHQKLDPKEINGLSSEAKSRISSPVSFSPPPSVLPCNNNIAPLLATAPKRKRPRLKFDEESSTSLSPKAEAELPSKMDAPASVPASPLRSEKKMPTASPAVENGNALADVGDHKQVMAELEGCNHSPEPKEVKQEIAAATSKSKDASCSDLDVNLQESTVAKADQAPVADSPREGKFSIDLMAPPPVPSGNYERDGLSEYAADHKSLDLVKEMKLDTMNGEMEQDKASKLEAMETASVEGRSTGKSTNEVNIKKHAAKERPNLDLQLDLEKQDKDSLSRICSSEHQQQVKQQSKAPKMDPKLEKNAHPASLPLTMPIAGWPGPGNFPHFGYIGQVPSLPAVMPIDGTSATSKTMQPPHFFPPQKPKRCATHCYIAQTIYYNQQIARMNSFWPPAAAAVGTAPFYGAKQYNLNVMPPSEAAIHGNPLQGGFPGRNFGSLPDKASPAVAMTYTGPPAKEKSSVAVAAAAAAASNTFMEAAQRKQFVLQQTPPQAGSSAAPPNMIHSPAFIFPIGQQPAAAAAAATRSAGSKSTPGIGNAAPPASSASSVAPGSTSAVYPQTTMSFNYAGLPPTDAQYLAILQNNAYPFPMPAHVAGGPSPFRGANPSQAMPFFNGSFYSSPMMHPSSQQQLRQHQQLVANQQPPSQSQQGHQNTSTSSGSSSSQKHHSQRVPGGGAAPSATAAGGNSHNFPGSKQHLHLLPPQARQLESEAGCEDSPSTADSSRVSTQAQKSIYGPNFAMSIHPQNFALISPAAAAALPGSGAAGGGNSHSEKQLAGNHHNLANLTPQAYAMPFAPFGGPAAAAAAAAAGAPGLDFLSMMQNHVLYQSLPEAARHHGFQQITAAATATGAHAHQHKKHHHEDRKSGDSATLNANVACEEGKMTASAAGKVAGSGAQHSLSFSRPDNDPPISGILGSSSNISEGHSRTLNLIQPPASGGRVTSRPSSAAPASNSSAATATNPSTSSPHMQPTQQQMQQQQQHLVQLQRQQQQQVQQQVQQQMQFQQQMSSRNAKSSSHNTNNAAMYSDRMGSPMARFPQVGLAGFSPSVIQGASVASSPQWKAPGRAATPGPSTSAASSSSSVKNQLPQQQQQQQQQQQGRAQQQQPPLLSSNQHQTHISFGVSSSKAAGVMGQPHLVGGSSNSSLTSVAAAAGSPQSSATKSSPGNGGSGNGGNGSPRASSSSKSGLPPATLLSPALPLQHTQNAKNSPSSLSSNVKSSPANNRNMTSILGHPHGNAASNSNSSTKFQQQSQQHQQQQKQQSFHQPQLFFSNPYMQAAQSSQSNAAAATASFYQQQQQQQRRQSEQQSQQHTQQQQQQNSTNTGVLSLCPSALTLAGSSAPSDPAKTAAAAAAGSMKGLTPTPGEGSAILQHAAQFSSSSVVQHPLMSATSFPYMHTMVSSVSVKPSPDPKAATGSDNLHWKPEKR